MRLLGFFVILGTWTNLNQAKIATTIARQPMMPCPSGGCRENGDESAPGKMAAWQRD